MAGYETKNSTTAAPTAPYAASSTGSATQRMGRVAAQRRRHRVDPVERHRRPQQRDQPRHRQRERGQRGTADQRQAEDDLLLHQPPALGGQTGDHAGPGERAAPTPTATRPARRRRRGRAGAGVGA